MIASLITWLTFGFGDIRDTTKVEGAFKLTKTILGGHWVITLSND